MIGKDQQPNAYFITLGSKEWDALLNHIENVITKTMISQRSEEKEWVSQKEAYRLLNINNSKTLNEYLGEGIIEWSELSTRNTLYRRSSIIKHIELKRFDQDS